MPENKINAVLVALYCNYNFPIRIMHSLLEEIDGVEPFTFFFKDVKINVSERPTAKEEELLVKHIAALNPSIVGFSVLTPFLPIALKMTQMIKKKLNTLVIWGGIHPILFPEECINENGVDIVCVGEGEGALKELVSNLKEGRSYQHINGLWVKDGEKVIKNPKRLLIQDLDSLPFPAYGKKSFFFIDNNKIHSVDNTLVDQSLSSLWVQSSRGCPYVCSYCVNSLLVPMNKENKLGPIVRRKSVDTVIREIKTFLDMPGNKLNYVYFIDEVFAINDDWLNEFVERYKKEIGLPFSVEYNSQLVNPERLDKLVRAGIHTVNFGIQTGSDHIRNVIFARPGKNKDIVKIAKMITGRKVNIKYDLIINNPYDTVDSLKEMIGILLQLPKPLFFNLFSLQYFPKYPFTERAIKDGYIKLEDATPEKLFETITKSWAFTPSLFPFDYKHIYQNIIWLMVNNHAEETIVRSAMLDNSLRAKVCLLYLNFKSLLFSVFIGEGGIKRKYPLIFYVIESARFLLTGNFKLLYSKVSRRLKLIILARKSYV